MLDGPLETIGRGLGAGGGGFRSFGRRLGARGGVLGPARDLVVGAERSGRGDEHQDGECEEAHAETLRRPDERVKV